MVRAIPLAALLFLAGCFGPAATSDDTPIGQGLDMSFFESCPVDGSYEVPCEANATNPFFVEVGDSWPTGWLCLTFADKRFEGVLPGTYYPYPDWYTLFGPALPDGAGAPQFQMGFAYDTHNDTDRVGGAIRLLTEDREELFTFEGPAHGVVKIPVHINGPKLSYVGVLYPATVGTDSQQYAFPPDFPDKNVTQPANKLEISGLDVKRSSTFWSLGPYRGEFPPPGVKQTFDVVRNVDADGVQYHFPAATATPVGIADHTDLQGLANWGMGRGTPFNTSVHHGSVHVEGSIQPYMFFGAKYEDVYNPVYTAITHWQCGCYGEPLASVDGALCFLGVPPPVVSQDDGTMRFDMGGVGAVGQPLDLPPAMPPGWPAPVRPDP